MILRRLTAPAIAVFFAAVMDLRAVQPVNLTEIIVDRDSPASVFLVGAITVIIKGRWFKGSIEMFNDDGRKKGADINSSYFFRGCL